MNVAAHEQHASVSVCAFRTCACIVSFHMTKKTQRTTRNIKKTKNYEYNKHTKRKKGAKLSPRKTLVNTPLHCIYNKKYTMYIS